MTSISINVYIDKLDDIVNNYSNAYHRTIKMKPVDLKSSMYIDFNKENIMEGCKCKVDYHVRIFKYIFVKDYIPNWSEEVYMIKKVKNSASWTCVISDLNREEIVGMFYEKELQ